MRIATCLATFLLAGATDLLVADDLKPTDPEHAAKMAEGLKLFKSDVRQVLIGRCMKCHGGEEIESEFDLTTRKALLKGGAEGPAVRLGKGKMSRLYRLAAHLEEPHMPEDGAKIDDRQLAAIVKWIDLGAPYDKPLVAKEDDPLAWTRRKVDDSARQFWAFQPLKIIQPPKIEDAWIRSDVDRFVLANLRKNGLALNPQATRRTLIRRAYFDLLGLPPTAKEVEQFVNDKDPRAYEKLIDRLLASPHYGERWGRHWLDVARFAESHGFEQDYDRPHAYHYRDFVIKALNADMPYDQFVRWQLAGDEFEPDNPLAMMATGFMGAGVFPTQLTEKEFEPARYDELDDMVNTMSTSMLGLSVGCARCHDHKFDPIPQADYYRMIATFATTIRSNIDLELQPNSSEAFGKWQQEHNKLQQQLKAFEQNQLGKRLETWLAKRPKGELPQPKWIVLDLNETKSHGGATLTKLGDGSLLASGANPNADKYTLSATTSLKGITAIRLEALAHPSMVKGGPGRAGNGNMGLGNFTVTAQPANGEGKPITIKLVNPKATFQQNSGNLSIAASIDNNPTTGWAVDPQFGKDHAAVFETDQAVGFDGGTKLTFTLDFNVNTKHNIGRPRLSISTAPRPVAIQGDSQQQAIVSVLSAYDKTGKLTAEQRAKLLAWYRLKDEGWRKLNDAAQAHLKSKPQTKKTKVMVTSEGFKPIKHHADGRGFPHFYKQTFFLKRGDATQKQGAASPSFLQVLMRADEKEKHWRVTPPSGWRTSYRRRSLANWITDTKYGAGHLLARVAVNRLWHHHFGRGIVATPNDFGFQGARPTNPELLDWLAARLIENGWRLKPIHKLMMTSAAYMQSSAFDEGDAKADPQNDLVWRYSPRRLEAEIIRDTMLAVSGQFDRTQFGPGTLNEGMKRRSIYFMIKRSRLVPMMQIFDSPEPLVSVGRRPSTTIAPQALLFMNNPHVRGYARSFAKQLATVEKDDDAVRQGYLTAIGREPADDELKQTVDFLKSQMASYAADKHPNPRELALADFAQVLMSLNEFIYVD